MNDFLFQRLVCPISKKAMTMEDDGFYSASCGLQYRTNDFRVGLEFSSEWRDGQVEYEEVEKKWLNIVNNTEQLKNLDNETADIYHSIKMDGDILDVGGAYGFVIKQAGLDPDRYISVDPIDMSWNRLERYKNIREHYSICQNAARVQGFAEFLPFSDASFDYVHMRSCIDHFANPKLALIEAFRVLRPGGRLVVGISLEGSYKKNKTGLKASIKRLSSKSALLRHAIELISHDHHMFHPTRDTLVNLINKNGFVVEKEIMQGAYHNVIYVEAVRLREVQVS